MRGVHHSVQRRSQPVHPGAAVNCVATNLCVRGSLGHLPGHPLAHEVRGNPRAAGMPTPDFLGIATLLPAEAWRFWLTHLLSTGMAGIPV